MHHLMEARPGHRGSAEDRRDGIALGAAITLSLHPTIGAAIQKQRPAWLPSGRC